MAAKKRFKVEVEHPEKLYEQFKILPYPNSMLGECPLRKPLEKIVVSAASNGESYISIAYIMSDIESQNKTDPYSPSPFNFIGFGGDMGKKADLPIEALTSEFKISAIGESIIILDKKDEPEYEVTAGKYPAICDIQVFFGCGSLGPTGITPAKKLTTLEDFVKDMERYCKVIETTVNGVYTKAGKQAPDITFKLRPQLTVTKQNHPGVLTDQQRTTALKDRIEITKPEVSFDEIGGLKKVKRKIKGLTLALKNPELYKKGGTRPPKGVLLFGPEGTGKTLLMKALATEADVKLYHVKISDITSMWFGESEKITQGVFDIAKQNGKSIIFFDELDALGSQRDHSHEASARIVSVMLENMDGIESCDNLIVVASTNRLNSIDPALKRAGRFDRLIEVPLPDEDGRKQIFKIHMDKAMAIAEKDLFENVDLDTLIKETDNYSGADIYELIRRALEENVQKAAENNIEPGLISMKNILKEIKDYERIREAKEGIGFQAKKSKSL